LTDVSSTRQNPSKLVFVLVYPKHSHTRQCPDKSGFALTKSKHPHTRQSLKQKFSLCSRSIETFNFNIDIKLKLLHGLFQSISKIFSILDIPDPATFYHEGVKNGINNKKNGRAYQICRQEIKNR
jgi:hypothetical protein